MGWGSNTTRSGSNVSCSTSAPDSADSNTAVGTLAGYSNATGTSNTFVGFKANASSGGFTNATAIGANAVVGESNALVLGNGANVGIGTSTPQIALDVEGAFGSLLFDPNAVMYPDIILQVIGLGEVGLRTPE